MIHSHIGAFCVTFGPRLHSAQKRWGAAKNCGRVFRWTSFVFVERIGGFDLGTAHVGEARCCVVQCTYTTSRRVFLCICIFASPILSAPKQIMSAVRVTCKGRVLGRRLCWLYVLIYLLGRMCAFDADRVLPGCASVTAYSVTHYDYWP